MHQNLKLKRLTSTCPWIFLQLKNGFFMYVNTALMHWFSKMQSAVVTSAFGTEFVAMKQGIDALIGLRYKLRIMGIPISHPSCI